MNKEIVILGLQKAAVILHALAFKVDASAQREALALVDVVAEAIKLLEAA
jgi:hypothetical protein